MTVPHDEFPQKELESGDEDGQMKRGKVSRKGQIIAVLREDEAGRRHSRFGAEAWDFLEATFYNGRQIRRDGVLRGPVG